MPLKDKLVLTDTLYYVVVDLITSKQVWYGIHVVSEDVHFEVESYLRYFGNVMILNTIKCKN